MDGSKIILDFLKRTSNLKMAKSGEDECFISPNTNVIWIGVEIKVTSYYFSSPLDHEDGSQCIYRSKAFLAGPNYFGHAQICLNGSKTLRTRLKTTFWRTLFHILNHIQNMSCPKQFGRIQNNLDTSKVILDP